MNFAITELISRVRWIAACALIAGPGLTHAQAPWAKDLVNPASAADDVILPMPCGGSMTFRRINIPSADALDDRRVQLGSPEPKFAYSENSRSDYVGGGFIDAKTKNQRYYLIGKYEVTRLQFDALSGTCPVVNPDGRLPKVGVTWNEAVFYTGHYADWLAKNGGAKLPQEDGMPGFVRLPTEGAVADLELCQGHQMCQGEAPEVFGFDASADQVTVLAEHPDDSLRSQVEAAVRYCPAMALAIEEES